MDLGNAAIEEMDTGYPVVSWNFSPGDPNPFYGRVVYGPGLSVDQPLTVTRYDYRDQPSSGSGTLTWPRFTWQIYWNYQGLPAYGTLTTGAWAYPYQLGPGQTSCPVIGNQTTQRCVIVQWPFMHSASDRNRGLIAYLSWHGSLLEGKRDRSGLEYRRNRQYDPQTGRFTQEDPIGLGGGLNLYGFAKGDPVNFSDPFGLCPNIMIGKVATKAPCELFGAVWAEMRGYGGYVYTAVAWSIRNRADKWYGADYHAAVWAPHQYSFTDETAPHDPNLRAYNAAVSGKVKGAEFAEMVESVENVYNGKTSDPTGGATHYLSPMTRGWDRLWPTWAWGDRSRISLDYGQVAQFFVCKPEHPRC